MNPDADDKNDADEDDDDDDVNNDDNNDDDIELCAKHAKVQLSITQACVPETQMSMDQLKYNVDRDDDHDDQEDNDNDQLMILIRTRFICNGSFVF